MASIHDVAKAAKVSKSTVSRVLTGGAVSPKARAAVLSAIDCLNYHPNAAARGLVTKKSRTIGVVVTDVADPYYSEIIRGADACACSRGYDIIHYNSRWEEEREVDYLAKLYEGRIDGLLLISGRIPSRHGAISELIAGAGETWPIVSVERIVDSMVPSVAIDNISAASMAVEHLLKLGHRRIGHIAGPPDLSFSRLRCEGYGKALGSAGVKADARLIADGSFSKDGGYAAARTLLELDERPTAIFAANDLSALGAWKAIREAGLRVPDQIALVGFDDIELLSIAEIPLTTVRQPRYQMGYRAAEKLVFLMEGGSATCGSLVTILPTELIIRDTCGFQQKKVNSLKGEGT